MEKEYSCSSTSASSAENSYIAKDGAPSTDQREATRCTDGGDISSPSASQLSEAQVSPGRSGTGMTGALGSLHHGPEGDQEEDQALPATHTDCATVDIDRTCPQPVSETLEAHKQVNIPRKPADSLEHIETESTSVTMVTESEKTIPQDLPVKSSEIPQKCLREISGKGLGISLSAADKSNAEDQPKDISKPDAQIDSSPLPSIVHSDTVPSADDQTESTGDLEVKANSEQRKPDILTSDPDSQKTGFTSTEIGPGTAEVSQDHIASSSVQEEKFADRTKDTTRSIEPDHAVPSSLSEPAAIPAIDMTLPSKEVSDVLPSEGQNIPEDTANEESSMASWTDAKELEDKNEEEDKGGEEEEDKGGEEEEEEEETKNKEEEEDMEVGSNDETGTRTAEDTGEDQASEQGSTGTSRKRHGSGSSATCVVPEEVPVYHGSSFPAANLFEYQWPPETGAEWYMLQEQISEFLTIKSFKRKYPELVRRSVDMKEKEFLKERGVVSETQCDLGLTALKSEEVLDLMTRDYPAKYQEYAAVLHEKERQTISDKHKLYEVPKLEKSKLADYMKKAVKSAAEFNVQFQRERREERRAYFDLQTMAIHYPKGKYKVAPAESTKVGSYPVTLIPGQFQDYHKTYTPDELKYFPLNTALYGPPKKFKETLAKPSSGDTSDDTAGDSAEDHDGSESGSDDGDSSESESTAGTAPPPQPPPPPPPPPEDTRPATPSEAAKSEKQKPKREKKEEKEVERKCRICSTREDKAKVTNEDLVQCSECKGSGHPTCLELTTAMIPVIKTYPWQCMECKTCVECMDPYDEDKMMFCDKCDRGYHTFCVGVKSIPTGRWECPSCRVDTPSKPKKSRRQARQNGVPSPKPAVPT